MIKNILNINGVKALTKTEQFAVLGGSVYKLVCINGQAQGDVLDDCHCAGLSDDVYLVQFPDDGTGGYTTYSLLGKVVDQL